MNLLVSLYRYGANLSENRGLQHGSRLEEFALQFGVIYKPCRIFVPSSSSKSMTTRSLLADSMLFKAISPG